MQSHSSSSSTGGSIVRVLVLMAALAPIVVVPRAATAGMLNPSDFASLGPLLSASGIYRVDTDTGIMTLPGGGTIAGNGGGVFTFGSIDIVGATFDVRGANPFVLLSQRDLALTWVSIDVSASGQVPGAGGNSPEGRGWDGFMVGAGGGGFGTAGSQGGPFVFTGDPHIIPPWEAYAPGEPGGPSFGGVLSSIQGGSAGGDFYYGEKMGSGGAGGGAIELGAGRTLSLNDDTLSANGGNAGGYAAGGGSGGSISLQGWNVDVAASTLSAVGGSGAGPLSYGGPGGARIGGGGDGGAGRIDIMAQDLSLSGSTNGVLETSSLPEPSSFLCLALGVGGATLLAAAHRGKGREYR